MPPSDPPQESKYSDKTEGIDKKWEKEGKEAKNEKFEFKDKFENEKPTKEKVERKEQKLEGKYELKDTKELKVEDKEVLGDKPPLETKFKDNIEKRSNDKPDEGRGWQPPIDVDVLTRHAEALESAARDLRHYIEQSERPDLRRGALGNEPDDINTDDPNADDTDPEGGDQS